MISFVDIPYTTDASGAATVETAHLGFGYVVKVFSEKGTTDATLDLTISALNDGSDAVDQITAITDQTADTSVYPVQVGVDHLGAAATGWFTRKMIHGKIRVVVAQGGNAKTGLVRVYIER